MGKAGRRAKGLHYGGHVPHGYVALKDGGGRTVGYALDPQWRWFFDELAIRFLRREPYGRIAQSLGNSPRTGLPWSPASIRFFCLNPFYRGLIATHWQKGEPEDIGPGVQSAAWDDATCAAMEREAARRRQNQKHGPRAASGLFSGIVRCGYCGRLMATNSSYKRLADGTVKFYESYMCFRPKHIRQGVWVGETHPNNFIPQSKLLALLQAAVAAVTPADVDAWLADLALPAGATVDPERPARLQADADALSGKLADLTLGLEGVRHASPAAAEAIIAEMRRTGQRLDALREELRTLARAQAAVPDRLAARAAMLRLRADPALFDRPAGELRPLLQAALPAVYVRDGALVPPVAEWPYRNRA